MRIAIPNPETQLDPDTMAVTLGALWMEQESTWPARLLRVDVATGTLTSSALPRDVDLHVADDGSLWAVDTCSAAPNPGPFTFSRVDPRSGKLASVAMLPSCQAAFGLGSIWTIETAEPASSDIETAAFVPTRTPQPTLVRRDLTGRVQRTWNVELSDVQVACGQVWGGSGGSQDPARPLLRRVDPASGEVSTLGGSGPVFDQDGTCWRWQGDRLEEVWPTRTFPGHEYRMTQPIFDGRTFWSGPDLYLQDVGWGHQGALTLQRVDPETGTANGPAYAIDPADLPGDKNGIEAELVSAGGWLWLVNPNEVIRFDIPSS